MSPRTWVGGTHQVLVGTTVGGTAVVYSYSVLLEFIHFIGVRIKATSVSGTPNLKVEWEASNYRPAIELAADSGFVVPEPTADNTLYTALADENWHVKQATPPPSGYGRLKITGNVGNPADSIVWAEIWIQE